MKTRVVALGMLLLGVLFAPVCLAGKPIVVSVDYAGYGYDTSVDSNDDGFTINLTEATGKGTFGKSVISITAEFGYPDGGEDPCVSPYTWLPVVVGNGHYWASVVTAADLSQLFALYDQGYLCLNQDAPFDYYGKVFGFYYGGTGRYAGASGTWESYFEGVNLDATVGYRSISGWIKGEVILP